MKNPRSFLYHLIEKTSIQEHEADLLFREAGLLATKKEWRITIDWFLLAAGALFLLSGIIFFFAYNWADLHKFAKIGCILFLILAATVAAWLSKPQKFSFRISLLVLNVLTGCLFSVFGQIYQTGANAYDLFLSWTVITIAFTAISNFPALWMLHLVLINITIILYAGQVLRLWWEEYIFLILYMLNALVVVAWEVFNLRFTLLQLNRWMPRTITVFALVILTVINQIGIIEELDKDVYVIALILLIITYAISLGYYFTAGKDLFQICIIFISLISIVSTLVFRIFREVDEIVCFFITGITTIVLTSILVTFMVRFNKKWNKA